MTEIKNPLEIYKVLPKTNCRQCGLPSCMAFAVQVLQGLKALHSCPTLSRECIERIAPRIVRRQGLDDEYDQVIRRLQKQARHLDFTETAVRIGAELVGERLAINCLGKDFFLSRQGELASACHINHWLAIPLLHYVLECRGVMPGNDWISFEELPDAGPWSQYFTHRCEEPLRQLADAHRDLLFELFSLFEARPMTTSGGADRSLTILPLPKVPFLIHYWPPEDGFTSTLNILVDRSAGDNINAQSINLLARGIIEMLRQLIVSHSRTGRLFEPGA